MIHLSNVTQHYGVRPVLQQVELKIPSGRLTGCSGPLAEVLARLTHPQTLDTIERYFEAGKP